MSTGATYSEWNEIEKDENKKQWLELKQLRDDGKISKEEFKERKKLIFPKQNI